MSKTSIHVQEWAKNNFSDHVIEEKVNVANTEISNRAQVSNSLKTSLGIERIMARSVSVLKNEFGPNGESVYELDNKDSRIRFVGEWQGVTGGNATRVRSNTVNDFIEITFYGTGLNLLNIVDANTSRDFRVTVDGGTESGNVYPSPGSSLLNNRNYATNQIVNLTSGLSLGWHTVKIRINSTEFLEFHGVEILNEATQLQTATGKAFSGVSKEVLSAVTSSNYNAGVTGTRGARVVKYLKDGVISQAVQEVDPAQGNLSSASHTNEEVIRKIHWREFGDNRSDDFSTLDATDRDAAFTLDDGTTTLVGNNVDETASFDSFRLIQSDSFMVLTFVGTGLDISHPPGVGSPVNISTLVDVDGVNIGDLNGATRDGRIKIVSGLPYGTHTVKIENNGVPGQVLGIQNFHIYGPKKPSLPEGAIELADYNVMADFGLASSRTIDEEGVDDIVYNGTLRKHTTREFLYVTAAGSWGINAIDPINRVGGFSVNTTDDNAYLEYTFFGDGFVFNTNSEASPFEGEIEIDGSVDLTGFTTSTSSSISLNTSTGRYSGNSGITGKITVEGLGLGLHTLRVYNRSTTVLLPEALDIITPIHINNTKIGSLSLLDSRKTSAIIGELDETVDLSKAKAWLSYDQSTNEVLNSYNISSVIDVATGISQIHFEKPFKDENYVAAGISINAMMQEDNTNTKTKEYFGVRLRDAAGTVSDQKYDIVFFGELEDES